MCELATVFMMQDYHITFSCSSVCDGAPALVSGDL